MATGDTSKVHPWADADALFGTLASVTPSDGDPFTLTGADAWKFGGILDGAAGFTETEGLDSSAYTGWGVGEIGETRRNYVRSIAFTLMEDNELTKGLLFDTSGVTFTVDGSNGPLAQRNLQAKFKFAQEIRSNGIINRRVTRNFAEISAVGDVKRSEDSPTMIPLTLKIRPEIVDNVPIFWDEYEGVVTTP